MITHLADTDRLIDYLNDKLNARTALGKLIQERVLVTSIIVVGEVMEGLLSESRPEMAHAFADLKAGLSVVGVDEETAERFASLRADLRKQGNLISDHDIWIASTAIRHDLTLITRDVHFARFEGLKRDAMTAAR